MINTRIPSSLLMSRITSDILNKQSDIAQVQEQIASGKKINRPSDNPAQAAHIIGIEQATSQLSQYQRNASAAESRLVLEESSLTGTANALMRIRELALSSNNGTIDNQGRAAINSEIRLKLDELYDLANMRDSNGNFLFSGSNTQIQPFSKSDPVTYHGSDDSQNVTIGLGRKISSGDSGVDVFMRVRNGNGDFSVDSASSNTGTGTISKGSVIDPDSYNSAPYTIQFTSPNAFDIIDNNSGTAIQTGVAYSSRSAIEFAGIQTTIIGTPAGGDSFTVAPSINQDIFTTVSKFVDTLDRNYQSAPDKSHLQQNINSFLNNVDNALDHINTVRSRVGTRLNSIDSSREENASINLQLQRTRSQVEDIDIAEAVTSLQTKASSLEILQKSFSRIESLSLFNYM